jgi:hypothetical protein
MRIRYRSVSMRMLTAALVISLRPRSRRQGTDVVSGLTKYIPKSERRAAGVRCALDALILLRTFLARSIFTHVEAVRLLSDWISRSRSDGTREQGAIGRKRQRNADDSVVVNSLYIVATAGVSIPVQHLGKAQLRCEAAQTQPWRSISTMPKRDGLVSWAIELSGKASQYRVRMPS